MTDQEEEGNEKEIIQESLFNLQLLQSRFRCQVNDLKALRHSVQDAVAQRLVTDKDHEKLAAQLSILDNLRKEYQAGVNAFNIQLGWKQREAAIDVNKSLEENLSAARNLKVNVEILMRRVKKQLLEGGSSTQVEENNLDDTEEEDSGDDKKGDVKDNKTVTGINREENGKDEPMSCKKKVLTIVGGIFIVIMFYLGLGGVIKFVEDNKIDIDEDIITISNSLQRDSTRCGADSFMLRDGVCDEVANVEKCLYDGGDCCKENKDKGLCRDCQCILVVDQQIVDNQFKSLDVKPVGNPDGLETAIGGSRDGWKVIVENVVSSQVCSVLCLDHKLAGELNAWHYIANEQICKCGWLESKYCPERMVIDINSTDKDHNAFVQLKKTVTCDCLVTGFLILSNSSQDAKVDLGDEPPSAQSVWHCVELCRLYADCAWVSWRGGAAVDGLDQIEPPTSDCRMMKDLTSTATPLTLGKVDSQWTSSSKHCSKVAQHFERFSTKGEHYSFICPSNKSSSSLTMRHTTIPAIPSEDTSTNFVIYLGGWKPHHNLNVIVLKLDLDSNISNVVECAHTISRPKLHYLNHATGGVLTTFDTDESVAVICGGEDASNSPNNICWILGQSSLQKDTLTLSAEGILNGDRVGSASLVVGNGSSLWVTGGSFKFQSEFVTLAASPNRTSAFPTNAAGPALVDVMYHHCIQRIGPDMAVVVGGLPGKTIVWSIDLRTMVWKVEPALIYGKFKHVCGILKLGNDFKALIAAGGIGAFNNPTDNMETILVTDEEGIHSHHWEEGPSLPMRLSDSASATTSDQKAFFVIGGKGLDGTSGSIMKLTCIFPTAVLQCSWTIVEFELPAPFSDHQAMALTMPQFPMPPRNDGADCSKEDGSILLLTTGWDGYNTLGDTEAFLVKSSAYAAGGQSLARCLETSLQMVQSMHSLQAATGGVLKNPIADEYRPIICGGVKKDSLGNDRCYLLKKPPNLPIQVGVMRRQMRKEAASIAIWNRTALWLTGGRMGDELLATTEWIHVSSTGNTQLLPGVPLPKRMTGHCLEMIGDNVAILFGGRSVATEHPRAFDLHETWTIGNLDGQEFVDEMKSDHASSKLWWTPRSPMKHAHVYHACGVIRVDAVRKFVVAAGGEDAFSVPTNKVELLEITDNDDSSYWKEGPNLPTALSRAASATTSDQNVLFVAGGLVSPAEPFYASTAMYSFRCTTMTAATCWWSKEELSLMLGRLHGLALIVPPSTEENVAVSNNNALGCQMHLKGNSLCDAVNNNVECEFDGGDCCSGLDGACHNCYGDWCNCHETGEHKCFEKCQTNKASDQTCDPFNNVEVCKCDDRDVDCEHDGGDCCWESGGDGLCLYCYEEACQCHKTDSMRCQNFPNCPHFLHHHFVGDGHCDDDLNLEDCLFDGGDCCLDEVKTEHCELCECHEPLQVCPVDFGHYNSGQVGDGYCDGDVNNKACEYDGGDCCLPESANDYCTFCSESECICDKTGLAHCKPVPESCLEHQYWFQIGNDACQDELNFEECAYDGGDCCLDNANCNFCLGDGCLCHETGQFHCKFEPKLCNGLYNNAEYNYDDGNCCLVAGNYCHFCNDGACNCHATGLSYCIPFDFSNCHKYYYVAYGQCDDESNVAECAFDGGDCCLEDKHTTYCSSCECISK